MAAPDVQDVKVRAIVNSGGGVAAEAELVLSDGTTGIGSAPVAIVPGRRERPVTDYLRIGSPPPEDVVKVLSALSGRGRRGQEAVDAYLDGQLPVLGTDVALAVSLAYARAAATASGRDLYGHLASLAGTEPGFPGLLAAVVSGGLHSRGHGVPFQQIMFATERRAPGETIPLILEAYERAERLFQARGLLTGYSASGGMLLDSTDLSLLGSAVNRGFWTRMTALSQVTGFRSGGTAGIA